MRKIFLLCFLVVLFSRETRSQQRCGEFEWGCKSGECIALEERCDGATDCRDASDETVEACANVECPHFSFRCAYGACVSGKQECDGKKDCIDNSDETSAKCPPAAQTNPNQGSCSPNFQCKSGRCIPPENACDGAIDCDDRSDETVELCASVSCPAFSFRCGYGACINGKAKCDGTKDCADGSDETKLICGRNHTTVVTIPSRVPGGGGSEAKDGCVLDSLPNVIAYYESDPSAFLKSGELIDDFSTIAYRCLPKHVLVGPTDNFCDMRKWRNPHPTCTRFCDNEVIRGVTFQSICEYGDARIPCHESPLLSGTRARISCQVGYQKPDKVVPEILVCGERGEWDYYPFKCEQVCGVEPALSTPFVLGGSRINNTLVPWHVGIYSQGTGKFEQICGGTIINAKIVISAAHCFWNLREDTLHDKSLFAVAAGKYYRNYYNTQEPLNTQFFQIEDLFVPNGYKDVNLAYVNDIAVVVLSQFIVFKPHIKPVCIEWQSYGNKAVRSDFRGRVAGWGKADDDHPSEELKSVDLPTVSYEQCVEEVEPRYKTLVTGDKFCVGRIPGEAVCEGDSGGGFAIPRVIAGQNVFYLWGVVSNGLTDKGKCTGEYFTAFTNIQFYQDMIVHYETNNRPR